MKKFLALMMAFLFCFLIAASSLAEEQSAFYTLASLLLSIEGISDDADLQAVDETQYSFPDGPMIYLYFSASEQAVPLILYARADDGVLYGCFWKNIPDKLLWYLLYLFSGNYDLLTNALPEKERPLTMIVSMGTDANSQMIIMDENSAATVYASISKMLGVSE